MTGGGHRRSGPDLGIATRRLLFATMCARSSTERMENTIGEGRVLYQGRRSSPDAGLHGACGAFPCCWSPPHGWVHCQRRRLPSSAVAAVAKSPIRRIQAATTQLCAALCLSRRSRGDPGRRCSTATRRWSAFDNDSSTTLSRPSTRSDKRSSGSATPAVHEAGKCRPCSARSAGRKRGRSWRRPRAPRGAQRLDERAGSGNDT